MCSASGRKVLRGIRRVRRDLKTTRAFCRCPPRLLPALPQALFLHLTEYLHASDLRVISAFKSFNYLHLACRAAAQLSSEDKAMVNMVAATIRDDAAAKPGARRGNSSRVLSLFSSGGSARAAPSRGKRPASSRSLAASAASDEDEVDDLDGVLSEENVPYSVLDLLVHADQRRCPVRMFHIADGLPARHQRLASPPATSNDTPRPAASTTPPPQPTATPAGSEPRTTQRRRASVGAAIPRLPAAHLVRSPDTSDTPAESFALESGDDDDDDTVWEQGCKGTVKPRPPMLCSTCMTHPVTRIADALDCDSESSGSLSQKPQESEDVDGWLVNRQVRPS